MYSPQFERNIGFDNSPSASESFGLRRSKSLTASSTRDTDDESNSSTTEIPLLTQSRSLTNVRGAAGSPPSTPPSSTSPGQTRPESASSFEHLPAINVRAYPRRLDPLVYQKGKSKKELEAERLEQERAEKREKERLERERLEQERIEKERAEKERLEKEAKEAKRLERERQRLERERQEEAARQKKKEEQERAEREKAERERAEREKELRLAQLKKEEEERRERELAEQSKTRCHHCDKPIVGQFIMAIDKTWHPDHFVCYKCNKAFVDGVFFEKDGRPYCDADYKDLFARKCTGCGQAISGQVTTANGQDWHPEHFVCYHCHNPFPGGVFFQRDGHNYCAVDYGALFAPKCAGCQESITGSVLTALGRQWHPEHFACTQCQKPLGGGAAFFERGGKPYCDKH
eukprot:TRINITY_DN1711_c0_g1_i2.p1 TRINITY_DN1711_c0_g1~~TRINITY_DN1711_c0_g1_i2.p1  ORF type:complete len:404 (-),score=53.02 TRINITY_DN1711_c0_g1_i2:166-1377(-)